MAGEYTPTADFEIPAAAYTPTPDFDFTVSAQSGIEFGLSWAVEAPLVADQAFGQAWSLSVFSYSDRRLDQSWALPTFAYLDRAAGLRWALAAPVFGNLPPNLRWGLAAPAFASASPGFRWAVLVPGFADRRAEFRWAVEIFDYAARGADLGWAVDAIDGAADLRFRQLWRLQATAVWTRVVSAVTYTLTLTGAPDGLADLALPMASYSSRLRSGESSYLQVSVPNARAVAADIAARPHGELVIRRGIRWSDGSVDVEEIARATLDLINLDVGARSSTASLQARAKQTNSAPKTVSLTGASYRALTSGRRRFRCAIDNSLRPGDTALIEGESMVVGALAHVVNPRQGWMEITEA